VGSVRWGKEGGPEARPSFATCGTGYGALIIRATRSKRPQTHHPAMQWYEQIIQILLIGIANGSIIALVALGYTLVYGIIELINFAHGDVFMIGTMVSLTLVTWVPGLLGERQAFTLPPGTIFLLVVGSMITSIAVCALLNVFIERVAYRRLRNAPRLAPLITAIGVSFVLDNIGLVWK